MYNYINIKNKDNINKKNYMFGNWNECEYLNFANVQIIWLSDIGETLRRNFESTESSYSIKNSFYNIQQKTKIENICDYVKKENCTYYTIKTGDDLTYGLRINKDLLQMEKINDLLMFNLYDYIYKLNLISNTKYDDSVYLLKYVKDKIKEEKIYFQSYDYYTKKIENIPEIPIHWVWFRKNNKKLTREISERALSWIILNPKTQFNLWTNLENANEFLEFIDEIEDYIQKIFISKITIHYKEETFNVFNEFMTEYKNSDSYLEKSYDLLNGEFNSNFKNSLIFKTDIFRLMILYKYGGIYSDFNDCLCLSPIKYIFLSHKLDEPIGVSDRNDLNHASNYFLYSPKENKDWKKWTYKMINLSSDIINFLKNENMKKLIKQACFDVINKMQQDFYENFDDCSKLNELYEKTYAELPYLGNKPKPITLQYWKILIYTIISNLSENQEAKNILNQVLADIKKSKRNNKKKQEVQKYRKININYEFAEQKFEDVYAFWWTDYSLNTIMHFTNLPIFCRMLKYDLYLLPFGYYMRYGCLLSYVCHLGDGGSYGNEKHNGLTAKNLYS